jgi:virginiamycin B lyase
MSTRDLTRRGALLLVLSLLPVTTQVLLSNTTTAGATVARQAAPTPDRTGVKGQMLREMQSSWDRTLEEMKSDLTPEWWHKLQTVEPSKWLDQYCSAKSFQMTKLCIVTSTAKALKDGKSADAVKEELKVKADAFMKPFDEVWSPPKLPSGTGFKPFDEVWSPPKLPSGTGFMSPDDMWTPNMPPDTGADRVPNSSYPRYQPGPSESNGSSAAHVVEHFVPAQVFPIDNKIAPDGADWFSLVTNNGTPGVGRIDPFTKKINLFHLPIETGITYAVNGGPGPYEWWTSIPFEGFGNKVGRINIYTHEVENWEIPTPYSYPADLKVGPDGAIWFTETRGNKIGRFDPETKTFEEYDVDTHALTPGPASGPPLSLPQDVAVIEDLGNPPDYECTTAPSWDHAPRWKDIYDGGACNATGVWWVNQSPYANSLQRIDPVTREITTYPFLTPAGLSLDISPGKDGRTVWFWFMGARKAGWFDPVTKVMTEFSVPSPNFVCCGGAGPDHAMYWSESHFNMIGRYDLETKEVTVLPYITERAYAIDWQIAGGSIWNALFRANAMAQIVIDPRSKVSGWNGQPLEGMEWPCGCKAPPGHPFNPSPHAAEGYTGDF